MKQAELRRHVLCALAVAGALTFVQGGCTFVQAASINGKPVDNPITNQAVVEAGSGKLVIGQGNLNVQTDASVGGVLNQLPSNPGAGDVLNALAPTKDNAPLVGVIGGEMQIDSNTSGLATVVNMFAFQSKNETINKIVNADTTNKDNADRGITVGNSEGNVVSISSDINTKIGSADHNPLIIGFIGGDASFNAGITGMNIYKGDATSITRTGNINGTLASGNVLLGSGASAGISVGNLDVSAKLIGNSPSEVSLKGKTNVTLDGDVAYNVNGTSNLGVWANGGAAVALGGESTSTVTGTSSLNIDHSNLIYNEQIDGVTGMVAGGGASVSTLGGTATTSTGDTTISINNALTGLVAGGGTAVSLDATAVYNNLLKKPGAGNVGNDNGTSDFNIGDIGKVTISNANQGGTATATTGDTHISLTGNSTALITAGGGVAGAWHSYTNRDSSNGTADNGQPGGTATAKAESGNVTIDVDLDTVGGSAAVTGVKNAVNTIKNVVNGMKGDDGKIDLGKIGTETLTDLGKVAGDLSGKGMAVGILGGGVAASVSDGGTTTSSTVGDVTINLNKGYAVGTFGGGLSANVYNKSTASAYDYTDGEGNAKKGQMKSETSADTVKITVGMNGDNDKAIGVFAGGVAVSSEYGYKHDEKLPKASDSLAVSTVKNGASIEVSGKADGVFGGGLAIGNSNVTDKGYDALASVGGTSSITVNEGSVVDVLNIQPIIDGTDDGSGQSFIGYNATQTMDNLKKITDQTAIAGGGMALGMSAKAYNENSVITVNGGTVKGDILGGGIAVDQLNKGETADNGAQVKESTITLNGGKVDGSVYAGGAVNKAGVPKDVGTTHAGYDGSATTSKVDTATVVLNGTSVVGEISGLGYQYENADAQNKTLYEGSVGTSTLTLSGNNTLSALDTTKGQYTSSSKIHDFDTVNVEAGSLTKVTGNFSSADKALINGGTVMVADGAKLDVHELASGTEQHIAANVNTGSTFWKNTDLVYDRLAGYAYGESENGTGYVVTHTDIAKMTDKQKDAAADEFGTAMGAGPLYNVIRSGYGANWDTTKGVNAGAKQFFQDWNDTKPTFNDSFGRAAMIGEDAAATGNTVSLTRDMADTVVQRLSFTEDYVTTDGAPLADGGIWAKYMHKKYETNGLASSFGDIHSDSSYDGAIVGVDFAKKGKFQSGAAFHYGSGDGSGSISSNDFDAYGFTLYGSLKDEQARTNLMADLGYVKTSNDITGSVNGKDVTADRDITAWTIGVRGEKEFVAGRNQIVPYVGLRYMSANPSAYDSYYDGQKLFHNDADNQNLWFLPVGVSLRNETTTASGWKITPKVDLAYIWAFGDKDTNMDVNLGTGSSSSLFYTVTDDGSWLTSVGVEAAHDAWTVGAGYAYQKGDDTKNTKWYINAGFAF